MDRIKMGEFPHQNSRVEHGILGRHAVKAMPIQGIQMRSQVMLNVASVILKGLRLTRYKQIYLFYSEVLLKKKKKKGNKCKWLGENTTKRMQNLLENTFLK